MKGRIKKIVFFVIIGILILLYINLHNSWELKTEISEANFENITLEEKKVLIRCLGLEYIPENIKFVSAKYERARDSEYEIVVCVTCEEYQEFVSKNKIVRTGNAVWHKDDFAIEIAENNDNIKMIFRISFASSPGERYNGFVDIINNRNM